MNKYQFPEKSRSWHFYKSIGQDELCIEICRRITRADITISLHGPMAEIIWGELSFDWFKVLYSKDFPMSKLDHRFMRALAPACCYLGNLPVPMVQHLADRQIPNLLWMWNEITKDDITRARVVGSAKGDCNG